MAKTDAEKKVSGTLQKCRVKNSLTYDPLTDIPSPAFKLNNEGLEYFNRFCSILLSNRTLTIADVPIITRAARYYEIYKEADEGVRKNGAIQETQTGYTAKTGYFVTLTDCEKRIGDIEALYGMNLTARTKINIPKPAINNPFDNI